MVGIKRVVAVGLLCGLTLATGGPGALAAADGSHRVNLNTATVEELVSLPGIGPSLAEAIVKYRAQEPFSRPEDVRKVKGIGDKLYERLKDQITVGDQPAAKPAGRGG